MATNVFAGRSGSMTVIGTSTGTGVKFGAFKSGTLSVGEAFDDATHSDSSGWEESFPVKRNWRFTSEHVALSTAATQSHITLRDMLSSGTRQWFSFYDSTASGGSRWQGYGYTETWEVTMDHERVVMTNFAVRGDGKLTES